MIAAVWTAWLPDPTPRLRSGSGRPSSRKNTSDMLLVVVLAGVDDDLRNAPRGRAPG